MNRYLLATLLILAILPALVNAIAVIVPVYVATLSIIAFVSNILITIAVYAAAKGFFNRKSFGHNFSEKLSILLDIFGKAALLIITTTISILWLSPVTTEESLATGLVAASISLIVIFLNSYRKMSILPKERAKIARGIAGFCIFVFLSCSVIAYFSVELTGATKGLEKAPQTINSPFEDIVQGIIQGGSSAPAQSEIQKPTAPSQSASNKVDENIESFNVILWPASAEPCIVSNLLTTISINPKEGCYKIVNNIRYKTFCPILVSSEDLRYSSDINVSGSCNDSYTIER
jgi:hypothetical protein